MDRATVAKYADMDDMTPKPPMDRRRGSKIDPYAALVDEWLEADRMLPRKQRHTARRVHDRLRAETGYDGEYTTTLRYVRRWREANRSGSDGYGELVWAPGVAQIDFGVAKARIAGELVDDHCLVVTLDWLQCIRQSDEGRLTWDWRPTMADPKHPRHYDEAFKRQIVQLYESGKPSREIRAEYDIARSIPRRWVQGIRNSGSTRAADNRTPEQNEPVELRKRNRQLEMEVDVSEQAAPVFARK